MLCMQAVIKRVIVMYEPLQAIFAQSVKKIGVGLRD